MDSSSEEYYSADEAPQNENASEKPSKGSRSSAEKSRGSKDEEVEFVVKNLDTGESFSSKEIEKKIPKGHTIDPIALDILQRSPQLEQERQEDKRKKKKKWLSKIKSRGRTKSVPEKQDQFAQIARQTIIAHKGAAWVMRFSFAGNYLATGGNDAHIHVWGVDESTEGSLDKPFFFGTPLHSFAEHKGDILDIAWSKSRSNLLLTASMDKCVKLWEVNDLSKNTSKSSFQHPDVVTAVNFHPMNEELFVTSCLDNKLRIWNFNEKKIVSFVEVDCGFITTAAFTLGGDAVITGSYEGKLLVFKTEGLHLKSQRQAQSSVLKRGKKITGIQMAPGGKYMLVSSNDSRVRMFSLNDLTVAWSYKGFRNENFQIYANFSENGKYIIMGSEDDRVYMWPNDLKKPSSSKTSTVKTRIQDSFRVAHSSTVTSALFAPFDKRKTNLSEGQIIVTCDLYGELKVFENKLLTNGRANPPPPGKVQ